MSSFQLSRPFGGQLTKMSIGTSAPLSFLLLGLQAMMDIKFSCPCIVPWNCGMSALIFFAPAIFALVIILLLLRPCKYKYKCSYRQDQTNRGKSQGEDEWKISRRRQRRNLSKRRQQRNISDIRGTSQGEDKRRTSQSEENDLVENLDCCKAFFVCTIPCLVWICIFFIDGDYLACGLTTWNGHYACDKELHPNCLNWCKPNEMSQGKTETEYERTRELTRISKIQRARVTDSKVQVLRCSNGMTSLKMHSRKTDSWGHNNPALSVRVSVTSNAIRFCVSCDLTMFGCIFLNET